MTRIAGLLFFLTAAGAALFLFHIKQEVRELKQELGIAHRGILHHQEAIQVLKTEWSYLNRPARIAELAGRHLELQPLAATQFVHIDEIPYRTVDAASPSGAAASMLTQAAAVQAAARRTAP